MLQPTASYETFIQTQIDSLLKSSHYLWAYLQTAAWSVKKKRDHKRNAQAFSERGAKVLAQLPKEMGSPHPCRCSRTM